MFFNDDEDSKQSIPTDKEAPLAPVTYPEGLVGDIARFIHDSSPRPSVEIAVLGAIGLMAGITGRAYNVSGTGLNQYLLLLALTGTGKEAMATGIEKLIFETQKQVPAAREFIGPAEISSGQALLRYIAKTSSCFVSVVGEFGLKLQRVASHKASSADIALKSALLDLYNKSGKDKMLHSIIYADNQRNTENVVSPAFTLLGESTPETFYGALDQSLIADGLLPRFMVLECHSNRPPFNKRHAETKPSNDLISQLSQLSAYCLNLMRDKAVLDVNEDHAAAEFLERIEVETTATINATNDDTIKQLWNRAHIKTLKLAALIAVGTHMTAPVITLPMAKWAYAIVERDIKNIMKRFEKGDVGKSYDESRQIIEMKRIFLDFAQKDYESISKYGVIYEMHLNKVTPYSYIHRRLATLSAFRNDKRGATAAIKRTLETLIESGDILQLPPLQLINTFKAHGKAYMINSPKNFILSMQ